MRQLQLVPLVTLIATTMRGMRVNFNNLCSSWIGSHMGLDKLIPIGHRISRRTYILDKTSKKRKG
jgi:hypothetical protein